MEFSKIIQITTASSTCLRMPSMAYPKTHELTYCGFMNMLENDADEVLQHHANYYGFVDISENAIDGSQNTQINLLWFYGHVREQR